MKLLEKTIKKSMMKYHLPTIKKVEVISESVVYVTIDIVRKSCTQNKNCTTNRNIEFVEQVHNDGTNNIVTKINHPRRISSPKKG